MTNVANVYCAPQDVQDILSLNGFNLRTDDFPPSAFGGMAVRAGNRVDWFLFRRYDPSQLALSPLVTNWAATIAAYYLCCRRGNLPAGGVDILYTEVINDMTEVKKGQSEIPGIGVRSSYAPCLSKMRATMRPYPRAVVETSQGTHLGGETVDAFQHRDAWDLWGANNCLNQIW